MSNLEVTSNAVESPCSTGIELHFTNDTILVRMPSRLLHVRWCVHLNIHAHVMHETGSGWPLPDRLTTPRRSISQVATLCFAAGMQS